MELSHAARIGASTEVGLPRPSKGFAKFAGPRVTFLKSSNDMPKSRKRLGKTFQNHGGGLPNSFPNRRVPSEADWMGT